MTKYEKLHLAVYAVFCVGLLAAYFYVHRTPQQQKAFVVVGVRPIDGGVKDGD